MKKALKKNLSGAKKGIDEDKILMALCAVEGSLKGLRESLLLDIPNAVSLLKKRKGNIITTGIGKSGFIAQKIAATFTSLGERALYLHPAEALHGDSGVVAQRDVIIAVSYSGQSTELVKLLAYLKKQFTVSVISITGNPASSLSVMSDAVVRAAITKEGSPHDIAPMASTTLALIAGDTLASALVNPKKFTHKEFAKFHPGGSLGLSLRLVSSVMHQGEHLPSVDKEEKFSSALMEINAKKFGITAVVGNNQVLVGVITDGDIRRTLLKCESPLKLSVKDCMTSNPKSIAQSATLKEAIEMMEKNKITTLLVTGSKGRLEGIVHIHDILGTL